MKLIMFFSSLNQRYDIIICVYWFELYSQVSDVAHGPLVTMGDTVAIRSPRPNFMTGELQTCNHWSSKRCKSFWDFLRRWSKRILKNCQISALFQCPTLVGKLRMISLTCTYIPLFSPSLTLETIPRDLKQMSLVDLVDSFNAVKAWLREGGWLTAF